MLPFLDLSTTEVKSSRGPRASFSTGPFENAKIKYQLALGTAEHVISEIGALPDRFDTMLNPVDEQLEQYRELTQSEDTATHTRFEKEHQAVHEEYQTLIYNHGRLQQDTEESRTTWIRRVRVLRRYVAGKVRADDEEIAESIAKSLAGAATAKQTANGYWARVKEIKTRTDALAERAENLRLAVRQSIESGV